MRRFVQNLEFANPYLSSAALVSFVAMLLAGQAPAGARPPDAPPTRFSLDLSRSLLVFSALRDEQWDLFAWNPEGSAEPQRLTYTPVDELRPSLSADRRAIAYVNTGGQVHLLDLATGQDHVLPFASDLHFDIQPSVSPDGRSVLLATSLSRQTDNTNLAIIDRSSENPVRQLSFPSSQFAPCWASDGVRFAFINIQARGWVGKVTTEIWMGRIEPPMARQLTMLDSLSVEPSWTRDGRRVLFSSDTEGQYEIYVVDTESRKVRRLTDDPAADTDPVATPSGDGVLFVSTRGGGLGLWLLREGAAKPVEVRPFGDRKVPCKDPDWR